MHWLKLTEEKARMLTTAAKDAARGTACGTGASLISGIAIVATAPAWMPIIGGTAVVSLATVGTCAAIGAGVGAVTGATREFLKIRKIKSDCEKAGFDVNKV